MKKRILSLVLIIALFLGNVGSAHGLDLGDLFGGLVALFGSNEETHEVGEVVDLKDLTIELKNVYESSGNSYYTPKKGNIYLIFEFEIKNTSKDDLAISTMLCFSAWCDDMVYPLSIEALGSAMLTGKFQLDCIIEPKKTATGVVGYEVPKNWSNAKIEFTPEAFHGERTTFVVSK